jgi:hypothetical protein
MFEAAPVTAMTLPVKDILRAWKGWEVGSLESDKARLGARDYKRGDMYAELIIVGFPVYVLTDLGFSPANGCST